MLRRLRYYCSTTPLRGASRQSPGTSSRRKDAMAFTSTSAPASVPSGSRIRAVPLHGSLHGPPPTSTAATSERTSSKSVSTRAPVDGSNFHIDIDIRPRKLSRHSGAIPLSTSSIGARRTVVFPTTPASSAVSALTTTSRVGVFAVTRHRPHVSTSQITSAAGDPPAPVHEHRGDFLSHPGKQHDAAVTPGRGHAQPRSAVKRVALAPKPSRREPGAAPVLLRVRRRVRKLRPRAVVLDPPAREPVRHPREGNIIDVVRAAAVSEDRADGDVPPRLRDALLPGPHGVILEGSRGRLRLREAAAVSSAVVRDLEEFLVGRAAAAAAAVAVAAAAEGHPKSQRVRISRERVDVGGLPVDVSPARGARLRARAASRAARQVWVVDVINQAEVVPRLRERHAEVPPLEERTRESYDSVVPAVRHGRVPSAVLGRRARCRYPRGTRATRAMDEPSARRGRRRHRARRRAAIV
eukprot:30936-Pelagococcus_subviridis.AAC.3